MENELRTKRGLILALVIGTMVIFVALVWWITNNVPWEVLSNPSPSVTPLAFRAGRNCTYPVSYWKAHPERYPPELVLAGQVYPAKDIAALLFSDNTDLGAQLQAQLVGAFLNMLTGSDQAPIESTVFQAYEWLVQHPDGNEIPDSEREIGSRLSASLEAYNLGRYGVSPCESLPVAATGENATAASTVTVLSTLPPGLTGTASPSPSPSPTLQSLTPLQTSAFPSLTPSPTQEEPVVPQPSRTYTPEPSEAPVKTTAAPTYTNTPVNTTQAPAPTDTPITPSPTLPPEPTITPTFPTIPN